MKTKKLKNYIRVLPFLLMAACSKSDSPETPPEEVTVVTTANVTIDIMTNVANGDVIGTVTGSSNKGDVSFRMASQNPEGAMAINTTTGELTVANASLFDSEINPTLSADVEVAKDEVNKTAKVTVNIKSVCNQVNLDPWTGDLITTLEGFDSIQVSGVAGECGSLTIRGIDPFLLGCELETEVVFSLIPSDNDATTGTLIAEKQSYLCEEDVNFEFSANGSYNSNTGILTINYSVIEEGVAEPFEETVTIVKGKLDNTDTDGDGVTNTNDDSPDDPCFPAQGPDYKDFDVENTIWASADCDGDGVTNGTEISNGTNPYTIDTDGDGINDNDDSGPLSPCLPAQMTGYTGFDASNATWAAADCDEDGLTNGSEVNTGSDPYNENEGSCNSSVETSLWNGGLIVEEEFDGEIFTANITGIAGCGVLNLSGDLFGFGCDEGLNPQIEVQFTPDSNETTNGTLNVSKQAYNCVADSEEEFEATGTYDETSGTLILDYTLSSEGLDPLTGTLVIKSE